MSKEFSSQEQQEEEARQMVNDLIATCPRCRKTPEDELLIHKAFELANDAHRGMFRKSGELYIFHPVAVARIAAEEIGLGATSVVAALMHDVVEDTDLTLNDLEQLFGPKVAQIVDGLTKLDGVLDQNESMQAENFRKLMMSMIEDVRVILIKFADRLHNMRTLDSMPEHKRYRIAAETLYIYAPIAHRLGLFQIKTELEDLSLKHEHPQVYKMIEEKLLSKKDDYNAIIRSIADPVSQKLKDQGLEFDIKARTKSIYSIWRKMQNKGVPFEEVYDIMAMRIVFKPKENMSEKAQCWWIYSIVTDLFRPNPDRLRDWVSSPKANGYEALHTTVMSPEGRWVEVQIRSERMDEIAERGFAAHWKYKEDGKESEIDNWIENIRKMLESAEKDSLEFLNTFKLNLYAQEIMVFSPKGDMKVMPIGSTALDFAFEIHTNLGCHCIGAKVNYKLEPMSHVLKSGDQVEIITSERQTPKYEWLNFVITAKAKTTIKERCKNERDEWTLKGKAILEKELAQRKLSINIRILNKMLKYYRFSTKEELYYQIGRGNISLDDIGKALVQKSKKKVGLRWYLNLGNLLGEKKPDISEEETDDAPILKSKNLVLSDESEQREYAVAQCCTPIPGDDVVAYVDDDNTIILHLRNCPTAMKLMSSRGDRIISAQWQSHKVMLYLVQIELSGMDRKGLINEVTNVISKDLNFNMRSLSFESHDGVFEGNVFLYVYNTEEIQTLISKLSKIKGIDKVARKEHAEED